MCSDVHVALCLWESLEELMEGSKTFRSSLLISVGMKHNSYRENVASLISFTQVRNVFMLACWRKLILSVNGE